MALYQASAEPLLTPAEVDELLVVPVSRAAVALNPLVSNTVRGASRDFKIPMITADPRAAWTMEGAEIALSDASLAELTITPSKVAGLSVVSSELARNSDPAAVSEIADAIARDIARRVDEAFWAAASLPAPAPKALGALVGVNTIHAGAAGWVNVDAFARAISAAKRVGATLTSFVCCPDDEELLSTLKESSTSNKPLLNPDATTGGTTSRVQGVPVLVSEFVERGTVWGLDASRVRMVINQDVELGSSAEALYSSDRVAIRGILRIGWGFPHAASVQKITLTDEPAPPTP